jgi:hypothetical protein
MLSVAKKYLWDAANAAESIRDKPESLRHLRGHSDNFVILH